MWRKVQRSLLIGKGNGDSASLTGTKAISAVSEVLQPFLAA